MTPTQSGTLATILCFLALGVVLWALPRRMVLWAALLACVAAVVLALLARPH